MDLQVEGLERNVAELRSEVNFWKLKHDEAMKQLRGYQEANC